MSYATLQDAVDGLRADNQVLADEVITLGDTARNAKTESLAARDAARLAETNAGDSEILSLQYKDGAESQVSLALSHKTDAEAAVPAAQTEKTGAEAARDTAVLTTLGPDNDKLASIASVYSQPSLMLDFAKQSFWKQGTYPWNQTTLDPAVDLTFTRASTKWVFDASGTLVEVPVDTMAIDHDPVTGESLGVLLEPGATNEAAYSVPTAGDGYWVMQNATADTIGSVSPDGVSPSSRLTATANSFALIRHVFATKVDTGYRMSVFAKEGTSAYLLLGVQNGTAAFDLASGAVFSGTGDIDSVGGGWYRCSVDIVGTGSDDLFLYVSEDGTNTGGVDGSYIDIWGVQLEEGTYPTSYIPTAGAAVTRAGDRLEKVLGGEMNSASLAGTFELAGRMDTADIIVALGKDTTERLWIRGSGGDALQASIEEGGHTQASENVNNVVTTNAPHTIGFSLKRDAFLLASDGTHHVTDGTVKVPVMTKLILGGYFDSGYDWAGHIKKVALYPRAMTEAELVELTS